MKRPGAPLTLEVLLEEAKFILRTLQRTDLFGEQVKLTEAERVLDNGISLNFADYCAFLSKFGYVTSDSSANQISVSEEGIIVASDGEDTNFHARLARHFAREIEAAAQPAPPPEPVPPPSLRPSLSERPRGVPEDLVDRRFRKERAIGEGTLGTVFRARQMALGRTVVLKEVKTVFQLASYLRRDEVLLRLRQRLEAHAALAHAFVLPVLDQNLDREVPYFVVQAASGNLRVRLEQVEDGRLAPRDAFHVVAQVAHALRHAHDRGVLHLGLKPENVLFDDAGNAVLSDFGIATITDRSAPADGMSQPPMVVGGGLVPYLAPERLRMTGEYDASTDLYGLGVIGYELLTGKLPGRRSPMPSEVDDRIPKRFDDIFDRLTRDDPGDRYGSVDDFLAELVAAVRNEWVGDGSTVPLRVASETVEVPEPVV
jgi:hypothetical protein